MNNQFLKMYINLSKTQKYLNRGDLELLCAIKQVNTNYLDEELKESDLRRFEALEFIEQVKTPKKGQTPLRLTKKAKNYLNEIAEAETLLEDEIIFNWLKSYYLKAEKEIGNGAKTKRHIRDFRVKSGIEKNNLINLVLDFLKENEERSKKLEYVFYYPKTAFDTKFTLDGSWLWNYFEKNRERLEKTFEQY